MSNELLGGPVAQAIGWSLLHLVWEAALVGAILAAVLALMSRRSANARYLVSCAALALLPFLAVITALRSYDAPVHVTSSDVAPAESAAVGGGATSNLINYLVASNDSTTTFQSIMSSARGWLPQIVLVWLAGVTFFSIRLVVSWTRVRKLARESAQPAGASWQRVASRLADALALKRAIALVESAAVEVPTVIGWLRPVILLPASTLSGLTPEQLEMVLAHELAHIRRHDFFVNLLQTVVETLMFYHPAVWWISNRIRDEREHCCDDLAIAVCGNPLQYARALTRLEELRADQTELAVAANGGSLMTRIRRLVVSQKESSPSTRWAAGAAVLAVVALLLTLPSLPALADHEADEKPAAKCAKAAKTSIDVHAEKDDVDVDVDNSSESDGNDGDTPQADPAVVPAPETAPAPAVTPAPQVVTVPDIRVAVEAPGVSVTVPPIATSVAPRAMALARAAVAGIAPRAPMASMRIRGDEKEFGASGKLSVDELIELRSAGVTPEYINDMRSNSGFAELTLRDIFELRAQGVTPEYLKQIRNAGVPLKTPREAVELRAMGVTPEYVASMAKTGYGNLAVKDLVELRAQGVTPAYIAELSNLGYKNLSVRDVVELRTMGVSTAFVKALAEAGYSNLSARDLVRLAASGVNADFIREMSQYRKK